MRNPKPARRQQPVPIYRGDCICGEPIYSSRPKKYHCPACRQFAYRQRKQGLPLDNELFKLASVEGQL